MNSLPKKEILGVGITSATEEKILEYIFSSVKKSNEKYYVVTPNPEIVVYAKDHPEFKSVLNKAEIGLCDGVGLSLAGKFLGKPIDARVTGVDLLEAICKKSVNQGAKDVRNVVTVGFLGAGKGVALKASERLMSKYPGLKVVFVAEEWSEEGFNFKKEHEVSSSKYQGDKTSKILNAKDSKHTTDVIDVLFVAFGFPKQEEWMANHVGTLPVRVMVGVGGAFDYLSGTVSRAPKLIRSMGMEWLYRLIHQPWRLKRQLVLPQFLLLVLKEKFR
jgi:N-acetylglucosaminyldiphosphoundecaprenol N-acetyl-beta-D-mannosaminyltransferase